MLNKILKYDLKSMFKSLIPFYIGILGLGLMVRLLNIVKSSFSIVGFVYATVMAFFIIMLIATLIYTFFVAIRRFYQNVLKDEGYLTNTLPVKRSNLILSKVLSSFITFIVTIILVITSLLIAFYTKGAIEPIIKQLNGLIETTGYSNGIVYSYLILTIILGYLSYIITFFLSLILGHSKNKNKIMYSLVYGIIIYIVLQVVSLISLGIAILIDRDLLDIIINSENGTLVQMNVVYILSIIISIVSIVIEYILSVKFINKKLNLE